MTFSQTYIKRTTLISAQNSNLMNQLKSSKKHADSLNIQTQFNTLNTKLTKLKDSIITSSPKSLTALFLIAGKQAELPPNTIMKTKKDTLNALFYIRKHYWKDVPF